ncbi:MAG: hypothetical protein WBQ63_13035 [Candidatus Acidiferrales bacterium]
MIRAAAVLHWGDDAPTLATAYPSRAIGFARRRSGCARRNFNLRLEMELHEPLLQNARAALA